MRISASTQRRQVRRLLAAILSQDPSESELAALAEQLRQGRLAYELAEAIEGLLRFGRHSGFDNEFVEVEELEKLVKLNGMRKEELVNIVRSLSEGGPWISGSATIRAILSSFVETAAESQLLKLRDTIQAYQQSDEYLRGVSKRE